MDAEFFEQRGVLVGEADEQIAAGIAMTIDLHRRDVGDVPFLEMDVFAADLDRARAGNAHFELVRVPADRHRLLAGLEHVDRDIGPGREPQRSEEHTSELQSLMRISYAVFCLKKKKNTQTTITLTKTTQQI